MNDLESRDHAAVPHRGPVMVVDDDRLVLLTLGHGLRSAGFEVMEVDNGDDAILLARSQRPALALLDIRMQGLSGFDVAQHFKDYERIPFMFVSAFDDDDIRQQAKSLGALACLSKPVDMADLVRRVDQALRSAHPGLQSRLSTPAAPQVATPGDEIALAIGMLMQRDALTRGLAWSRLQQLARGKGLGMSQAATELLAAHEGALPRP